MESGILELPLIDILIIAVYFILVILIGIFLSRLASKGIDDYFLGGRRIPWWVLGASGSASNFDMTGTMVITSFFFALGFQGFWVATRGGVVLPLAVLMTFMGKWLRRSKVLTTAEWMEFRFGSGPGGQLARAVAAIANLMIVIGMIIYFAKGTGLFLSIFLPFSPHVCALGMITVGLIYTIISGLWGVVYTDILQEVMILITATYIMFYAIFLPEHATVIEAAPSGWTALTPMWRAEPMEWLQNPVMYELFGICLIFWISRGLLEGLGGLPGGYMAQRYYAARDERSAGLMTAEWMGLLSVRWGMVSGLALLGLWLASKEPSIAQTLTSNPERTLPVVLGAILPTGLKGLAIAGLVAAAMSTFDSTINAGAAYWVKDIYQRYLNPGATDKRLVFQGYLSSLIIGVLGVALALGFKNINTIWHWITGPLAAGLYMPLILRWYWARFNGYGFAAGTIAGLTFPIILEIISPGMPFYIIFPLAGLISAFVSIATSLATHPVEEDVLKKYYLQMKPFGLWGSLAKILPEEEQRKIRQENTIDLVNMFFALGLQISLFITVITLVMHNWKPMYMSGISFILFGTILYLSWYKKLPKKGD